MSNAVSKRFFDYRCRIAANASRDAVSERMSANIFDRKTRKSFLHAIPPAGNGSSNPRLFKSHDAEARGQQC
jgi:hypothetical protein